MWKNFLTTSVLQPWKQWLALGSTEKALKLMAQYPSLIKRPVLDTGDKLLVGFLLKPTPRN